MSDTLNRRAPLTIRSAAIRPDFSHRSRVLFETPARFAAALRPNKSVFGRGWIGVTERDVVSAGPSKT